jgi:excisionase family DNA binding protein
VDHDANRLLAEAIGAVVREAVKDALSEISVTGGDTATTVPVAEAARRLGLGRTKVNELISSGDLPSVLVGKRRLLRPADLEAFAAAQSNGK